MLPPKPKPVTGPALFPLSAENKRPSSPDSNNLGTPGQGYAGVMPDTLKSFPKKIDNPLLHLELRACNIAPLSQKQ